MFAKERQDIIYKMVQKDGAVTTNTLIETFDVSIETIRRDLLYMERCGLLNRVHGGAVSAGDMKAFQVLKQRNLENSDLKRTVAEKAAAFVREGDIIGVDAGSTTLLLAEALKDRYSKLTVVTYSLDVFEILKDHGEFEVILCGGHYLKQENAFYGPMTLKMLECLHVQKAFICPSAVSMEFGICDYQQEFYATQCKMIENSGSTYILADSSKFEKKALLKLDDMRPEYCYVTDDLLSEELRKVYIENNIKIV